jgi:DNA-binding CsgD family transcriptional regulator
LTGSGLGDPVIVDPHLEQVQVRLRCGGRGCSVRGEIEVSRARARVGVYPWGVFIQVPGDLGVRGRTPWDLRPSRPAHGQRHERSWKKARLYVNEPSLAGYGTSMPVGGLLDRALLREIGLNAADVTRRARALQASAQQATAQARRIRLQSQQRSLARAADRREQAVDRREQAVDRREQAVDRREQAVDRREARETERERSADRAADERDRAADDRDRAADDRDRAAASIAAANRYPMVRLGSTGERSTDQGWASLTDGELRVVAAVAQGMSNRSIAKRLHLSRHTVDAHLKHVYLKLDIHTRVQLTVLALQHSA